MGMGMDTTCFDYASGLRYASYLSLDIGNFFRLLFFSLFLFFLAHFRLIKCVCVKCL